MHTTRTVRPVFLNLRQIRLPLSGVVSILHRISGILMALSLPVLAILLHQAVSGPDGFAATAAFLGAWPIQILLLGLLWSLLHHLFAGIRYLLLDLGHGLERAQARRGARIVLLTALSSFAVLAVILILGRLFA